VDEPELQKFVNNKIFTSLQLKKLLNILNNKKFTMKNFMSDYAHYDGNDYRMHYFMNYLLFQHLKKIDLL
jgi:hypothetical protein